MISRWKQRPGQASAAAIDLLFPPRCAVCDRECAALSGRPLWCLECEQALAPAAGPVCPRCAMPCPAADAADGPCPNCRGKRFQFAAARALGPYHGALRQAVLKMKHLRFEPLAAGLGQQLGAWLTALALPQMPELVIPVPMFWLKRLWRGTNPAESLARGVAKELRLPLASDALVCCRYTKTQGTLRADERRRNVRHAFRASWRYNLRGARILLVDDVMTTGATAQEAARMLRQAGAAAVYVAAVARGTGNA